MPGDVPMHALLRRPGQGGFGCVLAEGILERRCSAETRVMVLQELVLFWWLHSWACPAEQSSWPAQVCSAVGSGVLSSSLTLTQWSQCDGRKCRFCSMKVSFLEECCFLLWKKNGSSKSWHLLQKGISSSLVYSSWGLKVHKALFFPNLWLKTDITWQCLFKCHVSDEKLIN